MYDTPGEFPTRIQSARLCLRCYQAGDGPWFYAMGQRNRAHLARYEADNVVLSPKDENEAEQLVRELAACWQARTCFFMAVFEVESEQFVAQVYVGPAESAPAVFEIGFFADKGHEGRGYVTEAVRTALGFTFEYLGAHRVRMECDDANDRSRRVAERCGLIQERHIRQNKRNADGSLSGTLLFGLLRPSAPAMHEEERQ